MRILNTKRQSLWRPLTRQDLLDFKALVDGWSCFPTCRDILGINLESEENTRIFAFLDNVAAKEG